MLAAAAGAGFVAARAAEHDHGDQELARKVVLERELMASIAGKPAKVTLLELEYVPGGSSGPHRHAGPVVVYVLSGALESAIDDEPPKVYKAGETFFEPAGVLHAVSKNASKTEPARFLAFMLAPSDAKELTTPAK
ncbi:MAG: cupin domain-containing protein [Planctomycetaceae bacterium]